MSAKRHPVRCMCEFDDECSGTGVLHCRGCGGDLCICKCGGECDCAGCAACDPHFFEWEEAL